MKKIIVLAIYAVVMTTVVVLQSVRLNEVETILQYRCATLEAEDGVIHDMWVHYPNEFKSLQKLDSWKSFNISVDGDFEDLFYYWSDNDSIIRTTNMQIPVINNTRQVDSLMIQCVVSACDSCADTGQMDDFYEMPQGKKFWKLYSDYYE